MSPRKKTNPQPEPETESSFSENQNNEVELDVEPHNEAADDILSSASRIVQGLTPPVKLSKNQRYKANKKAREAAKGEDFSTIIVTLMTLIVSAWDAPEEVKPNDDELQAFSVPATRMMLRHIPIASKLGADALDIIGMIGAMSAYYVRTRPALNKIMEARRMKQQQENEGKAWNASQVAESNDGWPAIHSQPVEEVQP